MATRQNITYITYNPTDSPETPNKEDKRHHSHKMSRRRAVIKGGETNKLPIDPSKTRTLKAKTITKTNIAPPLISTFHLLAVRTENSKKTPQKHKRDKPPHKTIQKTPIHSTRDDD